MKLTRMAAGLSLVALLALTGCGSTAAAAVDPLTGTWSNATCFGSTTTPSDISSCTVALTFTSSLDVSLAATWLSMPATATYPGCTTIKQVTGQQWSTQSGADSEILTVTGTGTSTMARTGCVNMTDDLMTTPITDISIDSGDSGYQLNGGVLTVLSGDLAGIYND